MDKQTQKDLLELVKRNYEEIAVDFDITRKKYLWPELLKLADMVKDGDRVLDVGCGNGRLVEAFKNKNIKYLGVDSSEKLIESARNNIQSVIASDRRERSNLRLEALDQRLLRRDYAPCNDNSDFNFLIADILELNKLQENNFDYVFCVAVLHHLPGEDLRVEALEQMKRKLADDGKIVLTVWNLWPQKKFRRLIFKYGLLKFFGRNKMDFGDILFNWKNNQGDKISRRYYHAFTLAGLGKTVKKAELKLEKLYYDKYNYYLILAK